MLSPGVQKMLDAGYPQWPVDLMGYQLFPRLSDLVSAREDWNPAWWPLSSSLHHYEIFVRGDRHEEVWSRWSDADVDENGKAMASTRVWASLEDALEALRLMKTYLSDDAIRTSREGFWFLKRQHKWLEPDIVDQLAESWGDRPGPAILPWLGHLLSERKELAEPLGGVAPDAPPASE